MRKNKDRLRRVGVAALALAAASAAILGGASAASAASGTSNQGASDVVIAPDGGRLNFLEDEATGTFTWKMGDGQPDSVANWTVTAGDQATYVLNSPEGLTFPSMAPYCVQDQLEGFTASCEISVNRREITIVYTANASGPVSLNFAERDGLSFPVRAIDSIWVTGVPTVSYTPFPGLQTNTPSTTGIVQQSLPDSNQGVSNATITPLDGAVNFATTGTQGVLDFEMGDGSGNAGAPWSLNVGDESAYQVDLIEGLRFLGSNPVCPTDLYSFATTTCEISADQRRWIVRSVVHTAVVDSTEGFDGVDGPNWLVVSTADNVDASNVAGQMTFTKWYAAGSEPGSDAQFTDILFNTTPPNETPLLAGGAIAALLLAGGGAIYGIRHQKKATA